MFDLGKLFSRTPDHPMNSAAAARALLAAMDVSKPVEALVEIGTWANSLALTDGFSCADRFAVVSEIEGYGRRVLGKVFADFLRHIHRRDQEQRRIFESLHGFWTALAEAYGRCVFDHEAGAPGAAAFERHLAVAIARGLRACERAERTRQMRYIGSGPDLWRLPCRLYAYGETRALGEVPVVVQEREARSTVRAEFLCLAGMSLAALHELPPEQVELAGRVLERFAISFAWSETPAPDCNFVIDLAGRAPPQQAGGNEPTSPTWRFFGGGRALAKLQEIDAMIARDLLADEARFGKEFSQAQIVSVIHHLLIYLGTDPPRRRFERMAVSQPVMIAHGFGSVAPRVAILEAGSGVAIDEKLNVRRQSGSGMQLTAETPDEAPEIWTLRDRSEWGVGVDVPQGLGVWAEPGVLCGIREGENGPWWVGIIRRVDAPEFGRVHCGLWIMSKRPLATHLRVLGNDIAQAANWETSSGGFRYRYMRALLLPDTVKAHDRPVMLIERQPIWIGEICEIMAGEQTRHIQLMEMIEEGVDYMRVGFAWMKPDAAAPGT